MLEHTSHVLALKILTAITIQWLSWLPAATIDVKNIVSFNLFYIGVKSVLVGLLAQKAEVKFDKKKITTDEIICHVKELGFDCDLLEQCGQGEGTVDLIVSLLLCACTVVDVNIEYLSGEFS